MKIEKWKYKYIEGELYDYEKNKKTIDEERMNIIQASPEPADGMPKGSGTNGDPTQSKAMKLISNVALVRMEETVKAIKRVLDKLPEEYKTFFDLHYCQSKGIVATCMEANISERTYYNYKDRIVELVGHELGII